MVRIILLVMVALVAVLVAAVRYLPWWGVLLTLAGEALALYLVFKFAFQRILAALFMIPFKAKGAVLRGATTVVHSIEAAEAPPSRRRSPRPMTRKGIPQPTPLGRPPRRARITGSM